MKSPTPIVRISSLCERDVDLLLLEEFVSSPAFSAWFLQSTHFIQAIGATVMTAQRSVTTFNGESDLEVTLTHPENGRVYRLLIENKVGANLQPQQAERYHERGQGYVRHGICSAFYTVLVAPKSYFGNEPNSKGFDACLTYEAVQDWFVENHEEELRANYKYHLLSAAINKATFGWELLVNEPITRFWRVYWKLVCKLAPELELPEPTPKPSGSSFVYFHPSRLKGNLRLVHKVQHGNVDLQFEGDAAQLAKLRERCGPTLPPQMTIERAGKSAVIRVRVAPIDMLDKLERNQPLMIQGIIASQSLYHWFLDSTRSE